MNNEISAKSAKSMESDPIDFRRGEKRRPLENLSKTIYFKTVADPIDFDPIQFARTALAKLVSRIFLVFIFFTPLPACTADAKYQKLPVVVPFQLHKENTIAEVYFKITKEDVYSYDLYFKRTPEDGANDKVLALMQTRTEAKLTDGVPIAVSLEVYKIDGQNEILDSQWGTLSLPLFGAVKGNYSKEIYAYTMSRGNYKAILKTVKASPEFSEVPVSFRVGLANRPK